MNLLIALYVPLLCLEFGILVSSQEIFEAFYELLSKDTAAQNKATNSIILQFNKEFEEINSELYRTVLPMLNEANNAIRDHIENLENKLTTSGYNFTICGELVGDFVRNISSIASFTNVTAKAIEEKEKVYEDILYNIYLMGTDNINKIHGEVMSIADEFNVCVRSDSPEYCNRTLQSKLMAKQEEIPKLYAQEAEITKTNLIQQGLMYKIRVQDYVNEIIRTAKPYLSLLEVCVQRILSFGKSL